jgi:hypothetical protein
VINILTPSQYNWEAPLALEVWDERPPLELVDWDHVVEGTHQRPRHRPAGHARVSSGSI